MDDSPTYIAYLNARIMGKPMDEALAHCTVKELRAERELWSRVAHSWDYDPGAPDWLRSLAHENLQACESAFRRRRS